MCASNRVSAVSQMKPIVDDLLLLQDGIVMFDALWNQDVLVIAPVLACLCDNPRASEIVGHLRGNPNSFCRHCLVSCIYEHHTYSPVVNIQYVSEIQCDKKVCPDIICEAIARTKETMKPIFHDISQALPTRKSQLKTKYGLENESTPLLDLSFDVYRYTCT